MAAHVFAIQMNHWDAETLEAFVTNDIEGYQQIRRLFLHDPGSRHSILPADPAHARRILAHVEVSFSYDEKDEDLAIVAVDWLRKRGATVHACKRTPSGDEVRTDL